MKNNYDHKRINYILAKEVLELLYWESSEKEKQIGILDYWYHPDTKQLLFYADAWKPSVYDNHAFAVLEKLLNKRFFYDIKASANNYQVKVYDDFQIANANHEYLPMAICLAILEIFNIPIPYLDDHLICEVI